MFSLIQYGLYSFMMILIQVFKVSTGVLRPIQQINTPQYPPPQEGLLLLLLQSRYININDKYDYCVRKNISVTEFFFELSIYYLNMLTYYLNILT